MQTISKIIATAAAALVIFCWSFGTTGCSTVTDSAVATISEQTKDPMILARAAFLDAMNMFNDLGERYNKYVPYMMEHHPDTHRQIINVFRQMYGILSDWEQMSMQGIIPKDSQELMMVLCNQIIDIISQLERTTV